MSNNKGSKFKKWFNNNLTINKLKIFGINSIYHQQTIKILNNLDGMIKILITFKIQTINNLSRLFNKIYGTWILFLQIILIKTLPLKYKIIFGI